MTNIIRRRTALAIGIAAGALAAPMENLLEDDDWPSGRRLRRDGLCPLLGSTQAPKLWRHIVGHSGRYGAARLSSERTASRHLVPTSVHLSRMLDRAHGERVSVGWLMSQLGDRSFGLTLLVMAVIALVPGLSTVVGLLIAWPAIQLMLGQHQAVLPRVIARREVDVGRLRRVIAVVLPRLAWVERLIRPRWPELFETARRLAGAAMLLVGLTLISPLPFSHVVPALVVMLLALAYLEEDGLALVLALFAALCSLAVTGVTVWGAVETIDWIDPATRG